MQVSLYRLPLQQRSYMEARLLLMHTRGGKWFGAPGPTL